MFFPIVVFANTVIDGGFFEYEAVVINREGAEYQDSTNGSGVLPYNTEVRVVDKTNNLMVYVIKKNECCNTYKIFLQDIAPSKDEIIPEDLSDRETENSGYTGKAMRASFNSGVNKIMVVSDGGVKLKKGPADLYGEYSTIIPENTQLTSTHYIKGVYIIW